MLSEDFFRVIVFVTFVTFVMGARNRSRDRRGRYRNRHRNRNSNRTSSNVRASDMRDVLNVDVIVH